MLGDDASRGVRENPGNFYDPQNYKEIDERLRGMSDDELAVARDAAPGVDGDANIAVKAGLELFNRKVSRGQDVQADVELMSRKGTMIGQLLRQYAELKTSTPEGQLMMIEVELARDKRYLMKAQREKFRRLIADDFSAREQLRAAERMLLRDWTDTSAKLVDRKTATAQEVNRKLVMAYRDAAPLPARKILIQALQGNLLRPISQIRNIVGNLSFAPLRWGSQGVAAWLDGLESLFVGGRTVLNPFVGTKTGVLGAWKGVKDAGNQFIGRRTLEKVSGETIQGFRPLRAAVQAWSGAGLAVTKDGKVSNADRFLKALEAVLGAMPEPMLRMLAFGDMPFSEAVRAQTLFEQGKLRGFSGERLDQFVRFPDGRALEVAEKAGREATFQQESGAVRGINALIKNIAPGNWEVAVRTVFPYVKTPINLMTVGLRYGCPLVAIGEAMYAGWKGDRRTMNLRMGDAVVSGMMYLAAIYLVERGLAWGDPDRDRKRRGLQYGAGQPNSFNWSGLLRLAQGGDMAWRVGDRLVEFKALGYPGMVLTIIANSREAMLNEGRVPQDGNMGKLMAYLSAALPQTAAATVNLAVLKGTNELLNAIINNQYDRWLMGWYQAVAGFVIPGTLQSVSRARMDYLPEVDGFADVIKSMLGLTDDMPYKRDLFGRPIRVTPEGRNPWIYHFVDVTKTRKIPNDPYIREVYRVYVETRDGAVIPSIPSRQLILAGGLRRDLTGGEYEQYQKLVGMERIARANRVFINPRYQRASGNERADILQKMWREGAEAGKTRLIRELRWR
jgi:hypothetical protein